MSVAFESNISSDSNRIHSQGFSHRMWIYNKSESSRFAGGNSWSSRLPVVIEEDDVTSSSSIGMNSDAVGGSNSNEDDGEVQSRANGPLNGLTAFEEVLPNRRGISTFYDGKSKSFESLADASSVPSIHDIGKPEDAYSRKRKNMVAHNVISDKHENSAKRLARSSRSGLAFRSNINSHNRNEYGVNSNSDSSLPGHSLPPLPRNRRRRPANELSASSPGLYSSPWRSMSLSDMEYASAAPSSITGSVSNKTDMEDDN